MNEEAFLQAIQESPDDDLLRCVFADWLEEHGHAERSEFIRLQCRLAATAWDDPQRPAQLQREQDLLDQNAAAWLGPFHETRAAWHYVRGTANIRLSSRRMVSAAQIARAEEWFARGHVLALELHGGMQAPDRLLSASFLRRLVSLSLTTARIDNHAAQQLAACENLTRLSRLGLNYNLLGHEGIRALARSPSLGRLQQLSLRANALGMHGMQELARGFPRLQQVDLSHVVCGPEGIRYLVEADWLGGLTHLRLRGCRLGYMGVRRLAGSPRLAGLRLLDLRYNEIGSTGVLALVQSPHLGGLQALFLDEHRGIDPMSQAALQERFGPALKNVD